MNAPYNKMEILEQSSPAASIKPAPLLSIVVPYYRDNPAPLMRALDAQMAGRMDVELLLYDDGSNAPKLTAQVTGELGKAKGAMRGLTALQNQGRAFARNQLAARARGQWILFLDADMLPASENFISAYLADISRDKADIIFGGFTVEEKAADPERELHRALSAISDCLPLAQRRAAGPQYVATSNLAVRKSVLEAEPFDDGFSGWGWEDSEWAARVAGKYRLVHIDNPALHLGLETTQTLLRRFASSGGNYLRFVSRHPELAKQLKLYRLIQKLRWLPGQSLMRPVLRALVRSNAAPLKARLLALKLWRASWYAQSYKSQPVVKARS